MTAAEVITAFRAELAEVPDLDSLLLMAEPLLAGDPASVVSTLDFIVIRYCRARQASLELPEVTTQ